MDFSKQSFYLTANKNKLCKNLFLFSFRNLFFLISISYVAHSEVLELGASGVAGKKDTPEQMMFISRAPLELDSTTIEIDPVGEIVKTLNMDVFSLEKNFE